MFDMIPDGIFEGKTVKIVSRGFYVQKKNSRNRLLNFIQKVRKCIEMKDKCENKANCNLTTCRYNADGKCTNEEKRKECVRVSKAVLLIDDLADMEVPDSQLVKKL